MRRRPRGKFVVMVGPDGVGKTTVAQELLRRSRGKTAYFHFRPQICRPMSTMPPKALTPPPPKNPPTGSRVLGWMRLGRSFMLFWVAYLIRIRPALRRGTLIVGDRWAFGYLAQPYALRYYGPEWLARAVLWLMPKPDLVADLVAPAEVVHRRKQELSIDAIQVELALWRALRLPSLLRFDASAPPGVVAAAIAEQILDS